MPSGYNNDGSKRTGLTHALLAKLPKERFCCYVNPKTLNVCKKLKVKGKDRCEKHEGTCPKDRARFRGKNKGKNPNSFDVDQLVENNRHVKISEIPREIMILYGRRIGPKLRELLQQTLENTKLNDISEEILHTRVIAGDAIAAYSCAVELEGDLSPEKELLRKEALAISGSIVMDSMEKVAKLVERSAKIHALTIDKLPPNAIDDIVRQICRFVYVCFNDYPDKVAEFDQMLTDELQLPSLKQLGTTITPRNQLQNQVVAMDNTIPLCADEEVNETLYDEIVNEEVEE